MLLVGVTISEHYYESGFADGEFDESTVLRSAVVTRSRYEHLVPISDRRVKYRLRLVFGLIREVGQ